MEINRTMNTLQVKIGNVTIGGDSHIVVQTMCNTHTSDVEASFEQCVRLHKAGAEMIRLTFHFNKPNLDHFESGPPRDLLTQHCEFTIQSYSRQNRIIYNTPFQDNKITGSFILVILSQRIVNILSFLVSINAYFIDIILVTLFPK